MASEPTEEGPVHVDLDAELDEWLRSRAAALGVEPETVLVQLVASYRAAAELDDEVGEGLAAAASDAEAADERLEGIREEFQEKIEDVRQRVIQVKGEADAKADPDHDHEEFDRLDAIGGRLADLEEDVEGLGTALEELQADLEEIAEGDGDRLADVEAEVDDIEERLTTVAWVVSDLREAYKSKTGEAALEQLKRGAAAADVSRAKCENCGEGVEIGLLTEPACPHCDATVTKVAPGSGFFGKPQLLVASQLEAGDGE